ncbi:MAG: ABC transporter permease [Chryseolinea sp.]
MKSQKEIVPPKWATRILSWYCRPDLLEDLQGDLNEYFYRNIKSSGQRKARLNYVIDVFKFFRLYTLRKPRFLNLLIQYFMLGSYVKTSGRNIMRHKFFSFINIIGLAIGMSVAVLMLSVLLEMLSYDNFHEKGDRIYRVISKMEHLDKTIYNDDNYWACTSVKAFKGINENFTGIEEVAILRRGFNGNAQLGNTILSMNGLWANESFFHVFTFPLIKGDAATALKNPYSVVLTERTAKKIFGEEDAFGKTIQFKDADTTKHTEYIVTGIMKDIPKNSHFQFELLGSFSTAELQASGTNSDFMDWLNFYNNYTYVLLPKNTNIDVLQENLNKLSVAENAMQKQTMITLSLQPLHKIAISANMHNAIGMFMPDVILWVFGALGLVVILSACFNYTNLSIARSLKRSREIGMRKVIGATKKHVLMQFLVESVMISLLSLVFSFGLFLVIRPFFLSLAPEIAELVSLELSFKMVGWFILLAISVGIIAGLLPAIFFTRINPIMVLKAFPSIRVFRKLNLRKTMIVAQYTISLMFISATFIVLSQYKHFIVMDVGFTTENVLNIELQDNKPDALMKALAEMPEVTGISKSIIITGLGLTWSTEMKYADPNDSVITYFNSIDENYLPVHEQILLAGRNFSAKTGIAKGSEVIVNEQFLKRFNIAKRDPAQALGETIYDLGDGGKALQIIGVMKDFHYGTVDKKIEPFMFVYSNEKASYLNVKIASSDLPGTLAKIENIWNKIGYFHPVNAKYYDDQIKNAYNDYAAMFKVIGFLSFLAICISSLGLLGMVVFFSETRLKEISIRKVMGATELNLIYLLSKGFLRLILISAMIGLPLIYLLFDTVILAGWQYSAPITIADMLIGVAIMLAIALPLIGSQTLKVAKVNPASVLKAE